MGSGGFSDARFGRLHEVPGAHAERGQFAAPISPSRSGNMAGREGLGTSWLSDPAQGMVSILMERAWTSPTPLDICRDFWTLAYQAIDD